MDLKLLGSILLIVGTSIGAGMLGLPIVAAELGFSGSLLLLFGCWLIMTVSAFLILEVNLWLPQNNNLISMAKATLGPFGQIISWLTYLLLLYSLLCAYIAGGSDLFYSLFAMKGIELSQQTAAILFTIIFGSIVFLGIRSVDQVNRWLILLKFSAYFILVALLFPFISLDKLSSGNLAHLSSAAAITVTITSFGFAIIIPSLRVYFSGNIPKLKTALLIGSLIPLFIYIIWDLVIMGVIPLQGKESLVSILHSANST
ncbi:MAG TPA: aromatic amino acid transport family protein, partial [Gammaproteobacteria bacterium]|nr:aromatic amino acid transport family protein [Gammaproteobacteria bacterium]